MRRAVTHWRALCCVAAVVVLVAGCGGSGRRSRLVPAKKSAPTVTASVATAAAGSATRPTLVARPGHQFVFRVDPTGLTGTTPAGVQLDIPRTASRRLTVSAAWQGKIASATLLAAGKKPLALTNVYYPCLLPPEQTFCTGARVTMSKLAYQVAFSVPSGTHIVLFASTSGHGSAKTGTVARSGPAVPPYATRELIQVLAPSVPHAAPAPGPASHVTVQSGDEVLLLTQVTSHGKPGGPQPVTVSVPTATGVSLAVSARSRHGAPATASIQSAHGTTLSLTGLHFNCYLPPAPTFCPATAVRSGPGAVGLTFSTWPLGEPIQIDAVVR